MNYVRGAFSAVTSYYTSLPPINASTLTGAIDVIVVERINPSTGERELACSPFHVRLGKWQVLRPGEKAVSVLVNGKPIPYSMKIGDAGEAFFVFETEEDVPEELMTSPILGPTQVPSGGKESNRQAQRQHETAGRFGAPDTTSSATTTPDANSDAEDSSDKNLNLPSSKGHMNEPTFLDLDGNSPPSPTSASGSVPPSPRAGEPSEPQPEPTSSDSPTPAEHDDADPSSTLGKAKVILTAAPKLAKSVLVNAPNTAVDQAMKARDRLHEVRASVGSKRDALTPSKRADEESREMLEKEADAEAAQPPEILYGKDVALDMAGYHHAEVAGEESESPSEFPSTPKGAGGNSQPFPSTSSTPSPPSTPHHLAKPGAGYVRGGSAPPDVQVSTVPGTEVGLSTYPPDYTWEWGAFPTRSPARTTFKPLVKDDTGVVGPSALGKSVTTAGDLPSSSSSAAPPSSSSPEVFGKGGELSPDEAERDLFWVTIEGRRFAFELSLCDNAEGRRRRFDDLESARWFEEEKVEYARLLADPEVAENEGLVMKWGDRFITRRDESPLLTALLEWRHNMKPLPEHQYRRPPSSAASNPERSPPVSPNLTPANPTGMSVRDKRTSGTSWARWWSRSRTEQQQQAEGGAGPTLGVPPLAGGVVDVAVGAGGRPPLTPTASAPAELDMPEVVPVPISPAMEPSKTAPASINVPSPSSSSPSAAPATPPPSTSKHYVKTLRLSSDQLKALDLQKGANTITFALATTGTVACTAKIFVWEEGDRVVVSDIDGTITKSDALGHMFNLIGRDWTHLGVAKLYTDIARNGYKMMYLTSRAIGQADSTRDYLKGIKQNNYQLPEGPVIMSPDRLMASLHREVIMRKPEVFKMACLRDIQRLFGTQHKEPFYAGFGNRITDALSYRSVNVPSARIFTIDSSGEVKMELLELAGYKSSYIHMTDLVDQMFPPVHRKWATEFTDFNYWRGPLPDVDLPELDLPSPVSPALSAVSDTSVASRLSRLRNFSLRASSSTPTGAPPATTLGARRELSPSPLVRSVVSDDRSTTLADSASEGERRARRKSFDSMPGSLPGSEYGGSDGEEGEEDDGEVEEEEEDDEEELEEEDPVFDDDILQTEEMENVPFI